MNSQIESTLFEATGAPADRKGKRTEDISKLQLAAESVRQRFDATADTESASSLSGYTASGEASCSSLESSARSKFCSPQQKDQAEFYTTGRAKKTQNKEKTTTEYSSRSVDDGNQIYPCKPKTSRENKKRVHFSDQAIRHVYSADSPPEIDDVHIAVPSVEDEYRRADSMGIYVSKTHASDVESSCSSVDFSLRRCASSILDVELIKSIIPEDPFPITKLSRSKSDSMIFQLRKGALRRIRYTQDTKSECDNRKGNRDYLYLPISRTHRTDHPPEICQWQREELHCASTSPKFAVSREKHPKTRITSWSDTTCSKRGNSGSSKKKSTFDDAINSCNQRIQSSLEALSDVLPVSAPSIDRNTYLTRAGNEHVSSTIEKVFDDAVPCSSCEKHTSFDVPKLKSWLKEIKDENSKENVCEFKTSLDSHNGIKPRKNYKQDRSEKGVDDAEHIGCQMEKDKRAVEIREAQVSKEENSKKFSTDETIIVVYLKQCPKCGDICKHEEGTDLKLSPDKVSHEKYIQFFIYKCLWKILRILRSQRNVKFSGENAKNMGTDWKHSTQSGTSKDVMKAAHAPLEESAAVPRGTNEWPRKDPFQSEYPTARLKRKDAWQRAIENDSELLLLWEREEETSSNTSQDEMEYTEEDHRNSGRSATPINQREGMAIEIDTMSTPEDTKIWGADSTLYGCTLHPCKSMIDLFPLANDLLFQDSSEEEAVKEIQRDYEPKNRVNLFDNRKEFYKETETLNQQVCH